MGRHCVVTGGRHGVPLKKKESSASRTAWEGGLGPAIFTMVAYFRLACLVSGWSGVQSPSVSARHAYAHLVRAAYSVAVRFCRDAASSAKPSC